MSLKPNKPERKKPRAMPVETIVTRFKSKQKLLEKEQANTTNNGKKQKTTKNNASNDKKVIKQIKKIDTAEKNEIYADKLKRKIVSKKIMLVPRHSYKVIGRIKGCNKRKLRIPQKEIPLIVQRHNSNSSNELKNKQTEISIIDMIKVIEDSQSLDEEDLLEILTCPSPVWWEDPPDGYIEEAIFSRPQQKFEQKSVKTQILEEQIRQEQKEIEKKAKEDLTSLKLDLKIGNNIQNHDKTFVKKRSKLEIVLDNIIKSKTNKENKLESNLIQKPENTDNSVTVNSNCAFLLRNNAEPSAKLKKNIQKTKDKKRKIIKTKNKTKLKSRNKKTKLVKKCKKKRNSDSFKLSDIEDDILDHLENMDIPIEDKNETNLDSNKERKETKEKGIKEKETKEIQIEIKDAEKRKIKEKETKEVEIEMKDMEERKMIENETKEVEIEMKDMEEREINEKDTKENDKSRRISIDSNKSDKQTDEAEYLDMSVFDEIIKNETDYTIHSQFNEVSNSKDDDVEYVTVYKIINNETNNDINELKIMLPVERKNDKIKDGGKINDYYKHCKKVHIDNEMKSEKNDEISILTSNNESKASEKSILISEIDSIRYCFVCSSIFDKETCDYCDKKNGKKKKNVIFCDFCGLKVNSKHEMVKHLESHRVVV